MNFIEYKKRRNINDALRSLGLVRSPPDTGRTLFLGNGRRDRLADVFASEFYAEHSLHFAQNDVVGDATTGLVVVDNLRLLVDFRCEILLAQCLRLAALLDVASDIAVDAFMLQFFSLTIEFCSISGWQMLLVGSGIDCNWKIKLLLASNVERGYIRCENWFKDKVFGSKVRNCNLISHKFE